MAGARGGHDYRLLDALSQAPAAGFSGNLWRCVRDGRPPLEGSRGRGRWHGSDMDVLYFCDDPDGAMAEIHFHLSRAQPVFPSRMTHRLWRCEVTLDNALQLLDFSALEALGVEIARWHEVLYDRTCEIGAAAAFLGFDGLLAPSARYDCTCVVVFLENLDHPDALQNRESQEVDWSAWRSRTR